MLRHARSGEKLALTLLTSRKDNGPLSLVQGPLHGDGPQDTPYGGSLVPIDVIREGRVVLFTCTRVAAIAAAHALSRANGLWASKLTATEFLYSETSDLLPTPTGHRPAVCVQYGPRQAGAACVRVGRPFAQIRDGFGDSIEITYKPLTDCWVYDKGAPAPGLLVG